MPEETSVVQPSGDDQGRQEGNRISTKRKADEPPDDPNGGIFRCLDDEAEPEVVFDSTTAGKDGTMDLEGAPTSVRAAVLGKSGDLPMEERMADSIGRGKSGGAREPGQRYAMMDKNELKWRYIGSGIVARTFPHADRLILTSGRGPKVDEIDYRIVRDVRK